jgi:ankyrin repeat protein
MSRKILIAAVFVLSLAVINLALLCFVQWRRSAELERQLAALQPQWVEPQPVAPNPQISEVEQIHRAVGNGDMEQLRALLDAHPKLVSANTHNRFGSTPLHFAAYNKQPEIAAELIKRGADVNATNRSGMTPLHDAITVGSQPVVLLLLEHGADPRLRNAAGKDALAHAMEKNRGAIVEVLQKRTPDGKG